MVNTDALNTSPANEASKKYAQKLAKFAAFGTASDHADSEWVKSTLLECAAKFKRPIDRVMADYELMAYVQRTKSKPDHLMRPKELSDWFGGKPSEQTLALWRHQKKGPPYIKLQDGRGGTVLYRLSSVEKWLVQHEQT